MFCPKCGASLSDDAQFCGQCGNQLGAAMSQQTPEVQPYAAPTAAFPQDSVNAYQPTPVEQADNPYAGGMFGTGAATATAQKKNMKPIIIGVIAIAAVAAIIGILFATGVLGGGGGVGRAVALEAPKIISSDEKAASDAVSKMVELNFDELDGVEGIELYASSQDMADYVEGMYDDAVAGDLGPVESVTDLLSAEQAKKLNGQWVIAVIDNEDLLTPAVSQALGMLLGSSNLPTPDATGKSVVMVTVVADDELTSEELAGVVDSAGVNYEHVIAEVDSVKAVLSYAEDAAPGLDIDNVSELVESIGVKGAGMSLFWGEQIGMAVTVQSDEYAVAALYVANGADFGITPEMTKGLYLK